MKEALLPHVAAVQVAARRVLWIVGAIEISRGKPRVHRHVGAGRKHVTRNLGLLHKGVERRGRCGTNMISLLARQQLRSAVSVREEERRDESRGEHEQATRQEQRVETS